MDIRSGGRITSGYGPRSRPGGKGSGWHRGIDIVLSNRNIPSVSDGTVIANSYNSARGNFITIRNTDGYTNTYQHMASRSPLPVGAKVRQKQIVGIMGSTGISTGAHLHFEVKNPGGQYINPATYLSGGATYDGSANPITDAGYQAPSLAGGAMGILSKIIKVLVYVLLAAAAIFLIYNLVKGR